MNAQELKEKLDHHKREIEGHWQAIEQLQTEYLATASEGTRIPFESAPVHGWFELSYAHYLTIPRSVLQAMPSIWQQQFVDCVKQLDAAYDWRPETGTCYRVTLHEVEDNKFGDERWGEQVEDPLMNYRYPTVLPART